MSKWTKLIGKEIPRKKGTEPSFILVELTRVDKKHMQYGKVVCPYCGKEIERRLDVCENEYRSCGCSRSENVSKAKRSEITEHQDYNGVRFYKVATGYWKSADGKWMHRYVWETETGTKLPEGMDVHHIDRNRDNNLPQNLMAMNSSEHKKLHKIG